MGWSRWADDRDGDPGTGPSCSTVLQQVLFPFYLILIMAGAVVMIVGGWVYVLWLGIKELRARRRAP